jgi:P27 family predicted phage terminase small subunit
MDYFARQLWRRVGPMLTRLGLLTEADLEMFSTLCDAWGRLKRARQRLKVVLRETLVAADPQAPSDVLRVKETIKDGKVVDRHTTRLRAVPVGASQPVTPRVSLSAERLALIRAAEVSVERAEFAFRQLAAEFGLSPASRTRLDVEMPHENDFTGFLARGQTGRTIG